MKKLILLLFFCILIKTTPVFAQPLLSIKEADIPSPEIIYELPKSLIGEFIMINPIEEFNVTIFPNNKYIITIENYIDFSWGHIVNIDNKWFFSPLEYLNGKGYKPNFYDRLIEINLTDSGFSYSNMYSIRKENIPVPTNLAKYISLPRRTMKKQYFENENLYKFDFRDIVINRSMLTHSLEIKNGFVKILRGITGKGHEDYIIGVGAEYKGFIDIIEENDNGFRGIINFTNSVSYYYIGGGTAQIEKINDEIKISMLFLRIRGDYNTPEGFKLPAKLVLEF